jgi:hypothetical protein
MEEQAYFRVAFEEMRERAEPIVARILRDMPGYTVHDISHLDALWETASLVAGDGVQLNPAEAFVFGGSVLLHDAAMTLAAYPGGISELKSTVQWKDAIALQPQSNATPRETGPPPEIVTEVLRALHARKAADLAVQGWPLQDADGGPSGQTTHLIEQSDLRAFYGPTIGLIAHSHWWPVFKVEQELNRQLGAMPPKTMNTVDLLKLAGLLRVADAVHLDRRRAPPFVRSLDRPTGLSALHWDFQARLAFPHIEGEALVFTAGEATPLGGAEGWWLAYDALSLADRELRDTDLLLREHGRTGLRARRVKGAGDPYELSRLVPVSGWTPVETRVHISDVPHIVETLGGDKLYGRDATAPLRELIQNATDAVQARRRQQSRMEWGRIKISLEERGGSCWLAVEDDGVGMSENILTGTLLDFGSSLWRSPQVTEEFPGLASRGMNSIGRFGIGFFSVFMLADEVRVLTKRYNLGSNDGLTLTFNKGLRSRPILTRTLPDEALPDGGTRVELKLIHDPRSKGGLSLAPIRPATQGPAALFERNEEPARTLAELVGRLAPTSEVLLTTNEWGKLTRAVEAGDWRTVAPEKLARRTGAKISKVGAALLSKLMQPIIDEAGTVYGRAAIYPSKNMWDRKGALTSGGMRIQALPHIIGVIVGDVTTAARDSGTITIPTEALANWATIQAKLARTSAQSDVQKARTAEVVLECGGAIGQLPIVERDQKWLTPRQLSSLVPKEEEVHVHVGDVDHDDEDGVSRSAFEHSFGASKTIYFIPSVGGCFLAGDIDGWPRSRSSHLLRLFESILYKKWNGFGECDEEEPIGEVNGDEITRSVTVYWPEKQT